MAEIFLIERKIVGKQTGVFPKAAGFLASNNARVERLGMSTDVIKKLLVFKAIRVLFKYKIL